MEKMIFHKCFLCLGESFDSVHIEMLYVNIPAVHHKVVV